ncbi:response regulator [Streptomyces sp. SL13]|uniref:Transcriptional regulatory protein n=1 Tax=Streptantibioticus silvisoli TaxID=2705255 RepID=A0AA90HDM1_9ACTN|nr:response regulator [Streptantibioticus silvisoli]MDI5966528.1 response regulator [Streptantibioticus silvisoli]MDI5973790.1 response regulator [Streptantibioticus silvisoli]
MIDVLIVDDDFYVAEINSAYLSRIPGFRVVGQAHTAAEALAVIERGGTDLVLLDHYLPDETGLSLVRRLHQHHHEVDVIMVTASRDAADVRAALRCGVLQYLLKPFTFQTLRAKLEAYAQLRTALDGIEESEELGQDRMDGIFGTFRAPARVTPRSKGFSAPTAELVRQVLLRAAQPLSAREVADRAGLSRSTAQRYLKHLEKTGCARLTLKYGDAGRPEHHYEC